ncbi:MAG: hypothetical protein ABUK01_00405 [Leptospirales bacterium]
MAVAQNFAVMDMIVPGGVYKTFHEFTAYADFTNWVAEADKQNISEGYPYGKIDDPDKPHNLYVYSKNFAGTISVGSTFTVKQVVYHAKAALKRGTTLHGPYQCILVEFDYGGAKTQGYIWPVYNGWVAEIVPEGLSLIIEEGQLANFQAIFKQNSDGSYSLIDFAFFIEIEDDTLEIHVIDPGGTPLSSATMILTGVDIALEKTITITDGTGTQSGLTPGTYLIKKGGV